MADGSPENRADPKQMNDLTFSAPNKGLGDTKKCCGETFDGDSVKLSFYKGPNASESCEKSDTRGVAAKRAAVVGVNSLISSESDTVNGDVRKKKRCIDRYDSSESSDSGVAVLSPTESGGCSSSDITEPRSPRSPESSCSVGEEGASARMPPWASDPAAPPAPRRLAPQPAPVRRSQPPIHRRITEFFNHKMKPQNGLKRDQHSSNEDTKKKCLPKNGVTHDLEKYISYLSQTLSPKVLMDVGKHNDIGASKPAVPVANGVPEPTKSLDLTKGSNIHINSLTDYGRPKDVKEKKNQNMNMNGFLEVRNVANTFTKEKPTGGIPKGLVNGKRPRLEMKPSSDPSATGMIPYKHPQEVTKRKMPIPASSDLIGMRVASTSSMSQSPKKLIKTDMSKMNGVVSSTTTLDSRMNGVTCGSNNLTLNPITKSTSTKKETPKKPTQPARRTNRKSSACIANSKNITWSKANNLKQVQLQQKQNCGNPLPNSSTKTSTGGANTAPKMSIPNGMNGVRQVPMTMNGNLGNLNVPVSSLQNCHQLNMSQPCNGSVTPNNLASFVAVPQNVMLTTLRIPQNGISAQALGQQNNLPGFSRQNVNVSSPTKLNGQFVFPFMQNINGTVVQIPNLMAKMPNFVLPQTSQLTTQRQDHLQNQQATSILINGHLLKLANTVASPYPNVNKTAPVTSQPHPTLNKNSPGMQNVGMTVPSKPNYTVNFSHPVLMPQPGFIVTSVPNINVKETWSYTNTNTASSSQTTCSNPIVHHPPPIIANFTTQAHHTSSIPIAPVKPPDNPIQGTEPPSSTVKEPELTDLLPPKCDIPWLSKTVNNNIVNLDSNKKKTRPFAEVSSILLSEKIEEYVAEKMREEQMREEQIREKKMDEHTEEARIETNVSLRKVEEVARREETIFTQITVLKDVSSDVHNTVIEANFCSATTESESGIGTDKSIDSPSDSQASKECDEDSSLSLSVSVCSVDVQSQKSPILKQPKTLRFPPTSLTKTDSDRRTTSTDTTSTTSVCQWENCKQEFESDPDLLEHLQSVHVVTQAGKENYVCLWEKCKVRGKPSCSRLWLERHTLSHGGNKPFRCIVDGCERRFSSQTLLERHVNHHFNEGSSSATGSKKTVDSAAKLIRRNGKKLRYRRQPWSARMFDYFDVGIMEGLSWRLSRGTRWRLGGACPLREAPQHALTLRASLAATRCLDGRREALLTYHPPHVIEDEWVPEKEVRRTKRVEIASLPAHVKVLLYAQFCASYSDPAQEKTPPVTGAKKRKMGRRYGGNSFWPCGR